MDRTPINITGLDKYELLARLCNGTLPLGMGAMDPKAMDKITPDDIAKVLEEGPDQAKIGFDYLFGRPLKISLEAKDGKLLLGSWWLYDRDAGEGATLRIVDKLKAALKDIYEQLNAFDEHDGPTDAGDTLMGSIAHKVVDKGWARVDDEGRYHVTPEGKKVADECRRGIRD